MENIKTSKAQIKAMKKWQENNKEQSNYLKSKSSCKSFIKNKATLEDLEDIEQLIKEVKASKFI
jgi:hypothetical protein